MVSDLVDVGVDDGVLDGTVTLAEGLDLLDAELDRLGADGLVE